jgi:hypothetical protein
MKMCRALTEGDRESGRIITPDDLQFESALEAHRDMMQLEFVFNHLNSDGYPSELKSSIKKIIGDSVLPQHDQQNSMGRDTQFELFVGAICSAVGFHPVHFNEPDITCHFRGSKLGIAAKRIKTISKLKQRMRDAANQIKTSNFPGAIALDTCIALNRENHRIVQIMSDDEYAKRHSRVLKAFVANHDPHIFGWVAKKGVLGIVIHDHQVRMDSEKQWMLMGSHLYVCTCGKREELAYFRDFVKKCLGGLPNSENLSAVS